MASMMDMAKTPAPADTVITQQALNILRQLVAAQGWSQSILDIYTGGKLLAETLPQTDSIEWVKTDDEVKALSATERAAYHKRDREWGAKKVTVTVTPGERKVIERAFQHFVTTSAAAKRLGPADFLLELIVAFDIKDAPEPAKT